MKPDYIGGPRKQRARKRNSAYAKATAMLAILASTIAFAGCGSARSEGKALETSTLTIGQTNDPGTLDPAYNYAAATFPVVNQINESLLVFGKDLSLKPGLAKSWKEVNPTTYTYEIRDNVKFSDGSPLSADDVVFTLDRNRDPKTAAETQWMFQDVDSVEATGKYEVTVKLKSPDASWKYVLATSAGQIVSRKFVTEQQKNYGKPNGKTLGTGPYKLSQWTSGSQIVLVRNDAYWDTSNTKTPIKKIVYKVIADPNALALAAKSGQVNYVISPDTDLINEYKKNKNLDVVSDPSISNLFISYNTQRAPFDDVNVRRAVSYAIDAEGIRKNVIGDYGEKATDLPFGKEMYKTLGGTSVWSSFNKEHPGYTYNIAKAKEALKKSSKPNGFTTTLIVRPAYDDVAEAIQASLKQIGITVKLKKPTSAEYYAYIYGSKFDANGKRDYDFAINAWNPDYPDPIGTVAPLYQSSNAGAGGSNFAAYSNAAADAYIDKQKTGDGSSRAQAIANALAQASDDAAYKQLFYPKNYAVISSQFSYHLSPIWIYNFFVKDFTINK